MVSRRVRAVLWSFWGATFLLGLSAPLLRASAHLPALYPILAAVLLMAICLAIIRATPSALWLATDMSASAIALGGAAGFLVLYAGQGKGILPLLAFKWAAVGAFLMWLFLKRLKMPEMPSQETPEQAVEEIRQEIEAYSVGKSQEEIDAYVEMRAKQLMTQIRADLKEVKQKFWAMSVLSVIVLVLSGLGIWLLVTGR